MITKTKRNEILDQIEGLDQRQADEVLTYIKKILYGPQNDFGYETFKTNALKEIQKALKS